MNKQRHIIGRTVLEIDTEQIADVWSLQEDMSRLFQQQGVREMERLFDQLLKDEQVIRLDRVVVDIGSIDRRFLADEFIRNLINALRETLADHLADRLVGSAKTEKITRDRPSSDWEVLLYFLRYGRLPWWCPSGDWSAWFPRWAAVMQNDTNWQQSLRKLLTTNQAAKQRLIEQLPASFLHQLILQLQPAWIIWSTRLAQAKGLMQSGKFDSSAIRYLERQAWLLLLSEISADNAPTKPFPATWTRNWLAQLLKIWQQSTNSAAFQGQISPFNQIRQQISVNLQEFSSDEQRIWLTALEQVLTAISDPTARSLNQNETAELSPSLKTDGQVLLYFLEHGRLPDEQASTTWQTWLQRWETVISTETTWQIPLRQLLSSNVAASQRLITQLPPTLRHQLILQLQPAWTNWYTLLAQAQQLMQSLSLSRDSFQELETQAWELLLAEISSDNASLNPLPAANWTSNWLAQLVQNWRWGDKEAGGESDELAADVNVKQIAWERLRTSIDAISRAERNLWLNAYKQVLNLTATEKKERSPELPQTPPQTDGQVLLYFLEHGRLPDKQASTTWQTWLQLWETVIQTETTWQIPLRQLLSNNVAARQRLIIQLPPALRHQLILQLQPAWTNWYTLLAQAQQLMQSLSLSRDSFQELETQAWELLLAEISSDNASLNPLPAANWTSNWLAQLVQNWRWGDKEAGEQGSRGAGGESDELAADVNLKQIAWERLRTSIDAISRAERNLWLNAYNQVLNLTATEKKERSPQLPPTRLQTDGQVLLYFLEHGRLPDEQASTTWQTWLQLWETVIQTETTWQIPLRQLLKNNVASRQRLITQLPPALRHQLILQLQPAWTNWYTLLAQAREIMQSLNLSNDNCEQLEQQAWLLLLAELSSDHPSLNPLPVANWIRNWLTQLLQTWRLTPNTNQLTATSPPVEAAAPTQNQDATSSEIANQNPQQNLRQLIAAFPISDRTLWQNALEQVLTATSANVSTPPFETKTPTEPPILKESPGVPAPSSPETNIFTDATPTDEPTPTPQQNPSVEQVEFPTPEPTNPLSIPPRRARGSRLSKSEETAGLYVNQAGIVLLHPFLTFYLDAVGLLDGESFRDELAQQTAIYLLHYLATKQTDAPEYELVLPKLLCGWPLNEPVSRGLDLPTTALTEGENLLQTVINYWEALKSTSPDGLREGFLQRAGKLTQGDGNWKLQVEQQAIDILLSRLPWGLSMVKLPIMDDILIVEWH